MTRNAWIAVVAMGSGLVLGLRAAGEETAKDQSAEIVRLADQFFRAMRRGDAAAVEKLLHPRRRGRGASDGKAWKEDETYSVLKGRAEGEWGLALVLVDTEELGRGELPILFYREEGEWCVLVVAFAAAEIGLIGRLASEEPPPEWLVTQLVSWTAEAWARDPRFRDLEPGKPIEGVQVAPDAPRLFRIRLERRATIRVRARTDADRGIHIALYSPDGRFLPGMESTGREARAVRTYAPGIYLVKIGIEKPGAVTVELTTEEPRRILLNRPLGPLALGPGDMQEYILDIPEGSMARFLVVPIAADTAQSNFRVGFATEEIQMGDRGCRIELPAGDGVRVGAAYAGKTPARVFVLAVGERKDDANREEVPTGVVDLELAGGEPRFLRFAASVPESPAIEVVARDGAEVIALPVAEDGKPIGVIVHATGRSRVSLTIRARD